MFLAYNGIESVNVYCAVGNNDKKSSLVISSNGGRNALTLARCSMFS